MSAQSVAMEEADYARACQLLDERRVTQIVVHEARGFHNPYFFEAILQAAAEDNCDVRLSFGDGQLVMTVTDRDG